MGKKQQGGSWNLRLWLGSDYFPVGQGGSPHHLYLLSVLPLTGTRLFPLGVGLDQGCDWQTFSLGALL